jgi:valyl-tRNA synthetase
MELPQGAYNPSETEPNILKFWLDNKFYKPEYDPKEKRVKSADEMKSDNREPWALICPPPNAYARPHIGNISGYAYQDIFGRYNRMLGKKVLMVPGKDHAAQEAEVIFLKDVLAPQGRKKEDFTRDEFFKACYDYFQTLIPMIQKDEMRIGLSADFDRDTFTLDPKVADVVYSTFIKMQQDGMVYRDVRIVNWSPGMKSIVPDIETDHKEREASLYTLRYPLVGNPDRYVDVATTRPETMLGDTAVAVDPTDERYADLIGQFLELPLTGRQIPIIANGRVDKEFGTGAVKVTPAHSAEDYTIMLEWNYRKDFQFMPENVKESREKLGEITYVNVISRELKMVGPSGKYAGMFTKPAREAIVEDLRAQGLLIKEEKIMQNVIICDRSKSVIEPIMSSQWFIDVDKLKQPAIEAIKRGDVVVHPESMQEKMMHWLNNLRDWPISRSIWWGYQMPVWYAGPVEERVDAEGKLEIYISVNGESQLLDPQNPAHMKVQKESPGEGWVQDENVFDTWFSSGQWPYATLTALDLMDTFYPTQVMEMAYGILELWASRMIMLGLYVTGKVPFKDVYIQGHIKAADGRKMSKSLGNNVNMEELADKYGVDAMRLFYAVGNKAGLDYRVDYEKLEGNRRFLNKMWNAAKFILMNVSDISAEQLSSFDPSDIKLESNKKLVAHVQELSTSSTKLINDFNIGIAAHNLVTEFWHTFCDICIEEAKPHIYVMKDKETQAIISEPDPEAKLETQLALLFTLKRYLKLLHPFVPFITEELWKFIPKSEDESETIMYSEWNK